MTNGVSARQWRETYGAYKYVCFIAKNKTDHISVFGSLKTWTLNIWTNNDKSEKSFTFKINANFLMSLLSNAWTSNADYWTALDYPRCIYSI